jgi:hypothetical protein
MVEKGEESAKNIDADEPYRTSDLPKIMVFTSSYLPSGRCHNCMRSCSMVWRSWGRAGACYCVTQGQPEFLPRLSSGHHNYEKAF